VPCLPARVVAEFLADPRRIPYLLIWVYRGLPIEKVLKDPSIGQPREAVRLASFSNCEGELPSPGWFEVKGLYGARTGIRIVNRQLPRGGGKALLLVCNSCRKPRRALYGWYARSSGIRVVRSLWCCRNCSGLRYASEGGALVFRTRWALFRPLSGRRFTPRPEVWEPIVFTSPFHARDLGLVHNVYSQLDPRQSL
jgi:hypothetical protein